MQSKKVLILYTSHTLGHKSIAENIGYYVSGMGHTVELVDAMKTESTRSLSGYLAVHSFVNSYLPFIWRWMYLWGYVLAVPILKLFAASYSKKTLAFIQNTKPDMVITTQISASGVVSYLKSKGLYTGLFGIAFSDFHFHPAWVYENADFYLANILEQKERMVARGIPENKIFVCGITVKPKREISVIETRRKFGIPKDSKVILVSSGSTAFRFPMYIIDMLTDEVHLAMREQGKEVHTIIVCGKNKELYDEMKEKVTDSNFHILGFHEPMSELYAMADLYITKPGGLTVSEALQWNLPLFVSHVLAGQEELNLEYLSSVKLITPLYMKPERVWAGEIIEELLSGKLKNSLANNNYGLRLSQDSNGEAVKQAVQAMFHGL